jgi:outer membrane protein assembly factor BamB
MASLLLLIFGGGWVLWQSQLQPRAEAAVSVPGGHLWAASQHDAQATFWTEASGPASAEIAWVFEDESGFSGGPVVASDGTVYVASNGGTLYALSPEGLELWQAKLPARPVGAPALGLTGDIYVTDHSGNLSAVKPDGNLRWTSEAGDGITALTGPITDSEENIYYATEANLVAVTLDGALRWKVPLATYSYAEPLPRLSADNQYLLFEDVIVDAKDGSTLYPETPEPLDKYIVGTDGKIYLRGQNRFLEWRPVEGGAEILERAEWDTRTFGLGFRFPSEAGFTPDGRGWVLYESNFEFARLLWLDRNGEAQSPIDFPYRPARLIAFDQSNTTYMCGFLEAEPGGMHCRANKLGSGTPVWEVELGGASIPNGGAVVPGRLYVTTVNGVLYSIGDGQAAK